MSEQQWVQAVVVISPCEVSRAPRNAPLWRERIGSEVQREDEAA